MRVEALTLHSMPRDNSLPVVLLLADAPLLPSPFVVQLIFYSTQHTAHSTQHTAHSTRLVSNIYYIRILH
jgi:hypothetical protein